jgi:hypothetical protein
MRFASLAPIPGSGLKHRVPACDLQLKILIRHFGVDQVLLVVYRTAKEGAGLSLEASVASAHWMASRTS